MDQSATAANRAYDRAGKIARSGTPGHRLPMAAVRNISAALASPDHRPPRHARPGKNARDSSTTWRERRQATGEAGEANRSYEGTRRDERARSYESTRRRKGPKNSRESGIWERRRN